MECKECEYTKSCPYAYEEGCRGFNVCSSCGKPTRWWDLQNKCCECIDDECR